MAEIIRINNLYDKNEEKYKLLEIRNVLLVEKMFGDFITKSKLSNILDSVKKDIKDIRVSKAIDDVFSEYFKESPKSINSDDKVLPIEGLQDNIQEKMEYLDTGEQKGASLVKRDGHFNSSTDTSRPAA